MIIVQLCVSYKPEDLFAEIPVKYLIMNNEMSFYCEGSSFIWYLFLAYWDIDEEERGMEETIN